MTDQLKLDAIIETIAQQLNATCDAIRTAIGQAHREGYKDAIAHTADFLNTITNNQQQHLCEHCHRNLQQLSEYITLIGHEIPDYTETTE